MNLNVKRTGIVLKPNPGRVLFRPFNFIGEQRPLRIISRVLSLTEDEVSQVLTQVTAEFQPRHQKLLDFLMRRFDQVQHLVPTDQPLTRNRQLLIGSYFTHEYSLEAAALFNPSIIPDPDQTNVASGVLRFILSLRATGEGHISSITFRTGTIDAAGNIQVDVPSPFVSLPDLIPDASYEKLLFSRKLRELGLVDHVAETILQNLGETFTLDQLTKEIGFLRRYASHATDEFDRTARRVLMLAQSNYQISYAPDQPISERVIFPTGPNELNGIEDARFVRFVDDDGSIIYLATYTAYDGRVTIPQLLETRDFLHFHISTLNGPEVQNKGMALFPRRIKGQYATLSRQDAENLYIMYSDDLHFWYTKEPLLKPSHPWEFLQIGNCGSPIETDEGWLVITHGVGPMRKYSIGAILLDRDDPSRVIGRLRDPLLCPDETEREGYVPNVVYSCGSLVHNGLLILPYAMSDTASSFATMSLAELLAAMK
jgi:predicted GH43/DUF377 family glycosyl hydrolase